jgi:histidine ammonia-lyase
LSGRLTRSRDLVGDRPRPAITGVVAPINALTLTGCDLSPEDVVRVSRERVPIRLHPNAVEAMGQAHELLLQAARQGHPIYGLNRGVGLNKDKTIPMADGLTADAEGRLISEQFNRNLFHAHCASVGPEMPEELVRAIMLVRLNAMLTGGSGAQVGVAKGLMAFLNHEIHPVVPSRGSVGEADITILSHIGLALMGEGQVHYAGKRMDARQALKAAGLEPLVPIAKDALSIVSSNAASTALAVFALRDAESLLEMAHLVFALSLEGLNGNVAPFLVPVQHMRPNPGQQSAAAKIRVDLEGSYLWRRSEMRALQDPLSFRTASQVLGTAAAALETLKPLLELQLNSSDDNPAVIVGIEPGRDTPEEVAAYYVAGPNVSGAVIPTANFDPLPWVVPMESLAVALSHVSRSSAQRTIKLGSHRFTGLRRFLAPDDMAIAFGAIQKPLVSLDADNHELSIPVSAEIFPVAGEIEDTATNALRVVQRLTTLIDNLYYVLAIEFMHAAQAIDLHRHHRPNLALGQRTEALFAAYRRIVPFLDRDRALTPDIEATHEFLKAHSVDEITSAMRPTRQDT